MVVDLYDLPCSKGPLFWAHRATSPHIPYLLCGLVVLFFASTSPWANFLTFLLYLLTINFSTTPHPLIRLPFPSHSTSYCTHVCNHPRAVLAYSLPHTALSFFHTKQTVRSDLKARSYSSNPTAKQTPLTSPSSTPFLH